MNQFCSGASGVISSGDLVACGGKIGTFAEVPAETLFQGFFDDFGLKYTTLVDRKNTEIISIKNFKTFVGALAVMNARIAMIVCDEDKNEGCDCHCCHCQSAENRLL